MINFDGISCLKRLSLTINFARLYNILESPKLKHLILKN